MYCLYWGNYLFLRKIKSIKKNNRYGIYGFQKQNSE